MPLTELHIHAPKPTSTHFFAEHLTWKQHDLLVTLSPIEAEDPVEWFSLSKLSELMRELVEMFREENDVRYVGWSKPSVEATLVTLWKRGLVEHENRHWKLSAKGVEWANVNA